jgi:predicted hydrocarbon binding protein
MVSNFLKKLMFARQFVMDEGKIEVLGCDNVMLSSQFFLELQQLDSARIYEFAKDSTDNLMKSYFKKIGSDQTRSNETVEGIFNNFGLGEMEVVEVRDEKSVINVHNSTIAEESKKSNGLSNECVCNLTSGVLAGMFSFLLKRNVEAREVACIAKGDQACKFILS